MLIYNTDLVEKGEISPPHVVQWKDQSECFGVNYVYAQDKWHLCISTFKGCQIYNHNATRLLTIIESKKKVADGKVNIFLNAATAYDKVDGKEFIAVSNSTGEIYQVTINGTNYQRDIGFQMQDESAVTCMSSDARSKTLAVGNSNGYIIIFACDT